MTACTLTVDDADEASYARILALAAHVKAAALGPGILRGLDDGLGAPAGDRFAHAGWLWTRMH